MLKENTHISGTELKVFIFFHDLMKQKRPAGWLIFLNGLAASYSHRGKPPTTIGAEELNCRVRNGNGCDLFAIATKHVRNVVPSKLDNKKVFHFF